MSKTIESLSSIITDKLESEGLLILGDELKYLEEIKKIVAEDVGQKMDLSDKILKKIEKSENPKQHKPVPLGKK